MKTNTTWTFVFMTIATIIITLIIIKSMNHYSFAMAEGSEEAGIAYVGSPFHVLQSESVFYAGYVGQLATADGSDYIGKALGENPSFEFLFPGIIANAIWYSLLLISLNALILFRGHLLNITSNVIKQNGNFLGITKIVTVLITITILLFIVLYLVFGTLIKITGL